MRGNGTRRHAAKKGDDAAQTAAPRRRKIALFLTAMLLGATGQQLADIYRFRRLSSAQKKSPSDRRQKGFACTATSWCEGGQRKPIDINHSAQDARKIP
ncbi:hypothetical protein ACUY3Q_19405, partial [Xanthomonas arboricola pv. corylina]|uniref:hypothetical protein n=1 Tax=Xanthomonas arboricola TaxID=56448 RepID=UPI0040563B6C